MNDGLRKCDELIYDDKIVSELIYVLWTIELKSWEDDFFLSNRSFIGVLFPFIFSLQVYDIFVWEWEYVWGV